MTIIRRTNPLGELISLRHAMDRIPKAEEAKPHTIRITPSTALSVGGSKGTSAPSTAETETADHQPTLDEGA
jgi:hypothetical protein